jgi:DNA polymerase I-like protein with 3'-5' exonuclease and polymerase domains
MKELVIDFETQDDHLKTMGAGWAYGLGERLCLGAQINGTAVDLGTFITNENDINNSINISNNTNIVVAHNAQYDNGYLCQAHGNTDWLKDKILIDTVILAKLYNNTEADFKILGAGYSLEYLAKKYLKLNKTTGTLGDIVLKHKLINVKDPTTKLSKTKADNYAKSHMKQLYELEPEVVQEYCKQDVNLCHQLYEFYKLHIPHEQIIFFSDLLKVMIKARWRGAKVNPEALYDIKQKLHKQRDVILEQLKLESGNPDFNPLSTADVAQVLLKTMKDLPTTPKGNVSIVSSWLEEQEHPICRQIVKYRVLEKLSRDFCDNILEMQSILPEKYKGNIYPTFNILGAETGRMSCSGPNMQQIPNAKKHKELGALIRGAYIPSPGKLWASLDFAAQEPRLQVHYASLVGAEGADLLVQEYNKNPELDLHQIVSDMTGVSRNEAKTINLGLAYGMGITKLAASLNLSVPQAKILLDNFHTRLPYLKELDEKCKESLKRKGYIQTIGGRKLRLDKSVVIDGKEKSFEYKALNKLIQGSSADQIMMCLIELDKKGFTVISSIHDEINLEVNNLEEALLAKEIMENVLKLRVPVVAELSLGTSWGNAVKVTKENMNEMREKYSYDKK